MMVISVSLISRILLGSHIAKRASVPGSQVPSSAFTEGPSQTETVTRRATQSKQKSAEPQGAGKAPKRDPEKRTGNETAEHTLDSVQPSIPRRHRPHQRQPVAPSLSVSERMASSKANGASGSSSPVAQARLKTSW